MIRCQSGVEWSADVPWRAEEDVLVEAWKSLEGSFQHTAFFKLGYLPCLDLCLVLQLNCGEGVYKRLLLRDQGSVTCFVYLGVELYCRVLRDVFLQM